MFTYTIINPSTVMIILRNADFTNVAVMLASAHLFYTD
jgi:hypothetical protein